MPQISVIVPVYKVEPYLHRCVDSILNQTFKDFELILVDDGSPDGCPAICDAYAKQDPRVHVIHQPNGGLSAARNAGIDWAFSNSDSEWITFVDSDDWIHLEMLERLKKAVDDNHLKIAVCSFQETTGDVVEPKTFEVSVSDPEKFYVEQNVVATVAWGKLYHKSCFQIIRYPIGRIHEDEFTTYKILFAEKVIVVISARMYYYYQNENSIMHSVSIQKTRDAYDAIEDQIQFFEENGFTIAANFKIRFYLGCIASTLYKNPKYQKSKVLSKEIRRRKMCKGIEYAKKLDPQNNEDAWFLTLCFPRIMWLYWHWQALRKKFVFAK